VLVLLQGLSDFCVEPNDVLEDMASDYVERGAVVTNLFSNIQLFSIRFPSLTGDSVTHSGLLLLLLSVCIILHCYRTGEMLHCAESSCTV